MRILQVTSTFYPALAFGGPVKVAYDISTELAKRGHEVEVFATNAYNQACNFKPRFKENTMDGFKVTYFKNLIRFGKVFFAPEMIVALQRKLKEFDVIHIHFGRQAHDVAAVFYAKKYGIPYVLHAHGLLPRIMALRTLKWFYDVLFGYRLLRDAAKVVALSRMETEQYRAMGVPEEKIAIIPNGIDLSEYENLPPKGSFKRKYGIPEEKKMILYLGRIHRIKGINFLIKAYAHLTNEMDFKDSVLVVAGPDDGYLNEARSLVRDLGVSNFVLFIDPLYGRDKLEAFVDSEVYVLPSRYETFPMTVLEAYACGKPVIASEVGSLKDLVIDEETGLLFEAGDISQLAKSIHFLLNEHKRAEDMGLKGKRLVRDNFSIEKVVDKIEMVYEQVASAGNMQTSETLEKRW